jgi:uncharacterized protein (TIGR00251 family)
VSDLRLTERDGSVRLSVRVKPRASRSKLGGVSEDGALEVAVKAPPVEGAANAEVVKLVAKVLGVRRSDVAVVVGAASRNKVVDIQGLGRAEVLARLAAELAK